MLSLLAATACGAPDLGELESSSDELSSALPFGWHDGIAGGQTSGWTCDPDAFSTSLDVHFYEGATFLGAVRANQVREPAVAAACGGHAAHGFSFRLPASVLDGRRHEISAYAINLPNGGANPRLSGSPKVIEATATQPPSNLRNDARFVAHSVPASMTAGQTYAVSVTMENTGTSAWTRSCNPSVWDGVYRLGSQAPQDNGTWGTGRVDLAPCETIAPGARKTFSFQVRAPGTAGTYNFQWRMVQEAREWFGAFSPLHAVSIGSSDSLTSNNLNDGQTIIVVAHSDDEALWFQPFLARARAVVQVAGGPAPAQRTAQRLAYGAAYERNRIQHVYPNYATNDDWIRDFGTRDRCERDQVFNAAAFRARLEPYFTDASNKRFLTHNHWGEYGHSHHRIVGEVVRQLAVQYHKDVWMLSMQRQAYSAEDPSGTLYINLGDLAGLPNVSATFDHATIAHIRSAFQSQFFQPGTDTWTWHDGSLDYPHGTRTYVKIVDSTRGDLTGQSSQRRDIINSVTANTALSGACGSP
ncbi:MAG: hypothetical protein IPK13_07495 [Deltaproteobacteria bacterium]|nr:hypothetical protein [Deltaproteobacteria bacterium]